MLKLKLIACSIMSREISYLASKSTCLIDITFLNQGLHMTPHKLKDMIQEEIEKAEKYSKRCDVNENPGYDYILIGYGLCSNGIAGIKSSKIPLVIPRAHDCITLLLGSKDRYNYFFNKNPGTYWYSAGWIERGNPPCEEWYNRLSSNYLVKYGEDNAQYLMEAEQNWLKEYKYASLIYWNCLDNLKFYREFALKSAQYFGWDYSQIEGYPEFLQRILNGEFDEKEVLVVPPEKKVFASFKEDIIQYE
ncbi:MAG: DUF1638 domain-containing protein [Clostridia bacterium]|nr:DUF1638 domain-containing protein [Clostridia bacterium]